MCEHENIEVLCTFQETGEVFFECQDCGEVLNEDFEPVDALMFVDDEIPF